MKREDIQIRDPFVLPVPEEQCYYLFGTTDLNCWNDEATGFDCYRSRDLENWDSPIPAFRPPVDFWATHNFWAPEVHRFNGRFYMFATFAADKRYRGTQILVADKPEGPYAPLTDGPITPPNWQCLDGTLYVDPEGAPWIVFCHEWMQVHNGAMHAMQLSADLKKAVAPPVFLFNASEAPWAYPSGWPAKGERSQFPSYLSGPELNAAYPFPLYITDGPFLHRTANGSLLMLWSTLGNDGYTMGLARSTSGHISGPWEQLPEPLWTEDGGHGMLFRSFDGQLYLTLHQPNNTPDERPHFIEVEESKDLILLKKTQSDTP
jgi:arabinan endo-1,5-alpha-L-arabinosidase